MYTPTVESIKNAKKNISDVVIESPLVENMHLSQEHDATVLLKREDLQVVHSYKIRGAYNKISQLTNDQRMNGVVCASAGNHAQGVAYACNKLGIKGHIYMPLTTPKQKIDQVKMFGNGYVEIVISGDTFDSSNASARKFCNETNSNYIHPFDDPLIIEGQATIALELLQQSQSKIDYVFVPIGGGGLISGLATYFNELSPDTKIIGVEPEGAPSMKTSIEKGENTTLDTIDKFVDGAAVKRCGELTFDICKDVIDDIVLVPEGKICTHILRMYNRDAMVLEPAGALAIAALDYYKDEIKGKNVVCIVSGSNNDIVRTAEIRERSMLFEGLKHYFIVQMPQRAGALKEFVGEILQEGDEISHFEYSKKTFREKGPVVIGVEVQKQNDVNRIMEQMDAKGWFYEYLNDRPTLFQFLI